MCLWSIDGWEKRKAKFLQAPAGRAAPLVGETKVQFHNDQVHLLVSHESQLAIYDGKLDCVRSVSFLPFTVLLVLSLQLLADELAYSHG